MAPLNMMVKVVMKEEDSADAWCWASIEEILALEFEKKFSAGAGCGVGLTLQASWVYACVPSRKKQANRIFIFVLEGAMH